LVNGIIIFNHEQSKFIFNARVLQGYLYLLNIQSNFFPRRTIRFLSTH